MAAQLYIIHSNDAGWVTRQREALVGELVPPESRDENLNELFAADNQPLPLGRILPDLLGELGTISMFGGARVLVVHNCDEFVSSFRRGGRGKKKKTEEKTGPTPSEALARFIENDLAATENILIFSTITRMERGEQFNEYSPIYKMARPPIGKVLKRPEKETDPLFLLIDAMNARNTIKALEHFRFLWSEDSAFRILYRLMGNVRFLLQVKALERIEKSGKSRDTIETLYLPGDRQHSIYKQHEFVQKKTREAAARFQIRELMQAMNQLFEINRVVIPGPTDKYRPDIKILFETFLIGFCEKQAQHIGR